MSQSNPNPMSFYPDLNSDFSETPERSEDSVLYTDSMVYSDVSAVKDSTFDQFYADAFYFDSAMTIDDSNSSPNTQSANLSAFADFAVDQSNEKNLSRKRRRVDEFTFDDLQADVKPFMGFNGHEQSTSSSSSGTHIHSRNMSNSSINSFSSTEPNDGGKIDIDDRIPSVNIEPGTPPSYSGSVGGTNEQGGQTLGRELSNSSSTINPPGSPYSNRSTASQPTVYTNFYARSGTSSSSSDQTSSLIDHGFSSFDQFDEIRAQVQNFLQEESLASKVRVLTAKVCQKSYRGEKRWLTPPPLVEISGEHWPTGYCENITVDASYFTTDEEGLRSYLSNSSVSSDGGSSRGNSRAQRTKEQLDDKNNACFKQLYIGEMGGKINQLTIDFSLNQESSGIEIGQFASKPIRVIPKPTKTSKKVDLSITSGSKVALFIRLRSQTVDNRYLKMNDSGMLSLETNTWSAFTIKGNGIREGSDLKYGDEVVLTASNGATTNPMRIMRMDKGRVDFDSQDQICHLQHVAMQLTSNNLFLATSNHSNLSMFNIDEGDVSAVDNNFEWTIVGTNEMTYTFYEGDSPSAMSYPVSAVPIVERIQLHSDRKKLSLHGYDMNDSLSLWFGDTNVPTEFRCEELIVCTVPTMEQLVGDCEVAHVPAYCKVRIEVPLILVRPDGLLYPTGQSFIYDAVPLQVYEKFAKKGLMRRVQ